MKLEQRIKNYAQISTELACLDDQKLSDILEKAEHNHSGIGGKSVLLNIDGVKVFAKKIPLIDLEVQHFMSTANLFDLPLCYQYGVGSTGFGAWRELVSHIMTTNWVLSNECPNFPMMYSWRICPVNEVRTMHDADVKKLKETVENWNNSKEILKRLQAINASSRDLVVFLEYIPDVLWRWLHLEFAKDNECIDYAMNMSERDIHLINDFLKTKGFVHFDAHFGNYITDGKRLYLTDFGLALSEKFDLSVAERNLLERRKDYDRCQLLTNLVNWLVVKLYEEEDANDVMSRIHEIIPKLLQDYDGGRVVKYMTPSVANILRKYKDIAFVWYDFFIKMKMSDKNAIYPKGELEKLLELIEKY
jgi:thiamine kinase-like enzyme